MRLQLAAEDDLEQLLALQKKAFHGQALIYNDFNLPPLTQTIDDLKKEFKEKKIYKIEVDGKIVGSVRCFLEDGCLHIEKLIVDPDQQNKGIGTFMMEELEQLYAHDVKRYALFTGEKSERNLHLYRKLGYKEVRREPTSRGYELIYMEKNSPRRSM